MKLFKKPNSKFYWYDFTVRGYRYRGSTQETKSVRAVTAAVVLEGTDPLPSKPTAICEFAERFLAWVADSRLEEKTKKFYRNGWRLLKATPVVEVRVNQITSDCHKRVARIMREDNLLAVQPRQFVVTTKSDPKLAVYLNLAGRMKLTGRDQLWVADITYIRLKTEFVYLA